MFMLGVPNMRCCIRLEQISLAWSHCGREASVQPQELCALSSGLRKQDMQPRIRFEWPYAQGPLAISESAKQGLGLEP